MTGRTNGIAMSLMTFKSKILDDEAASLLIRYWNDL